MEGAGKPYMLNFVLQDIEHQYVLWNVVVIQPWLR